MKKKQIHPSKDVEIASLVKQLESQQFQVRFEKGFFKNNLATVNENKIIFVNRNHDRIQIINYLKQCIEELLDNSN